MAIELDDGTIVRSLPEQVSYNDERIEETQTKLTALEIQVQAALAGVLHYKGSVATYSDLPATGNEVGDVWNVLDTGKNYAWSGTVWDELGGIVDLSHLVTLDTEQTISAFKTFTFGIDTTYVGLGQDAGGIETVQGGLLLESDTEQISFIGDDVFPNTSDLLSLGTPTNRWKEIFVSDGLNLKNNNTDWTFSLSSAGLLQVAAGGTVRYAYGYNILRPNSNNELDLGSSSYTWKDVFISGKIDFGNTVEVFSTSNKEFVVKTYTSGNVLTVAPYSVRVSKDFLPASGINVNLGNSAPNYMFNNLYLKGNINDGTNSVTIADLAALIAYAKAQGWIS